MKIIIFPLIVGLGIGLLLTAQFKAPRQRILNPVEPFTSLHDTRDRLTEKSNVLKSELKTMRQDIAQTQDRLKAQRKTSREILEEFDRLKAKVGLTELKDSGVVATLSDAAQGELTADSIIHAADVRDVINILWRSGARAISINDERVVATTSIDSIVNTILVNNTRITGPFVIKATGDSRVLADAINAATNLEDLHRRQKSFGIVLNVERVKEVNIAAYSGSFDIKFARVKQ